jgi:hypothetical protein
MPDNQNIEQYFKDNNIDLKDIRNLKLLLQQNNDLLESGLRSNNSTNFRNLCIFNAQDSLDATYPMYLHFNIISDTVKIVSVKLSFWLLPFRAYDTTDTEEAAATSSTQAEQTSSSVAEATPTSSSVSTPSGGGATSEAPSAHPGNIAVGVVSNVVRNDATGYKLLTDAGYTTLDTHVHDTPNHVHPAHTHTVTVAAHSHTVAAHSHTVPAHTHGLTFGIYEENNSPTIGFQISSDNGLTYGDILGQFTTDEVNLEIKDYVTAVGSYIIKFTSSARARVSAQLTAKIDIKALNPSSMIFIS